MKTDDFDYYLPQELIAQSAPEDRPSCRLLVVHRDTGEVEDRHFYDIIDYLREGDCLVMNDSRVIPARIYGIKEETGARIEFLLHRRYDEHTWEVMARPGKRLKIGTKVYFGDDSPPLCWERRRTVSSTWSSPTREASSRSYTR